MHVKTPTGFRQHLRTPIACASLATLALAGTALADRTVKTDPMTTSMQACMMPRGPAASTARS